jgi:hypothetical protein
MLGAGILRILTPKVLKGIMKYVFEENELDIKMQVLENRVSTLEKDSHPQREFVICETCNKKIKEK